MSFEVGQQLEERNQSEVEFDSESNEEEKDGREQKARETVIWFVERHCVLFLNVFIGCFCTAFVATRLNRVINLRNDCVDNSIVHTDHIEQNSLLLCYCKEYRPYKGDLAPRALPS